MALVTVQRSPCGTNSPGPSTDESDGPDTQDEESTDKKGISECYFAVKGAALVLPHDECLHLHRKNIANGACDIQQHLQSMLYLLHADDILKMAVKLESAHGSRTRYLVVVYHGGGAYQTEESCLLGVDCNRETTIGLLLPVWADTKITLDGDGGFSVTSSGRHHIFKPVSVQAMWSALQTLHKASSKARECNYFKCGGTHQWVDYYESRIASDRSCLNEWHAMDDIESRRPPSPDTVRVQPTEREETERHIRTKLKELMMSVDLDEVTSKYIRTRLEEILDMNLKEYKSFIDQEMLTILGQMDSPTEIFQYLYLGSEWNASNLEELVVNGIGHILNVTREIDNFFPGMFDYQNIRVYDDESTEILHYWDKTYRYIRRAKDEGSKVLVHCKMGISRSASVVIAYVMKAYDWDLQRALEFVKTKRGCIKPNSGFLKQLEIYQGILDASKQRHNSLWRSKSETNLKSSSKPKKKEDDSKKQKVPEKSESLYHLTVNCGASLRPKSWSPSRAVADMLFPPHHRHSARICDTEKGMGQEAEATFTSLNLESTSYFNGIPPYTNKERESEFLCAEIPNNPTLSRVSSIKDRINELELQVTSTNDKAVKTEIKSPTSQSRSGLVFNLANHFESASKPSSPVDEGLVMKAALEEAIVQPVISQTKPPVCKHHAVLVKPSLWPTEPSESATLGKTSPKVVLIGNNSCDSLGQKLSSDGPKTSHSAFKPLNLQSRGPLDQKQGQFIQSCPVGDNKTLPPILGKNNPLSNKEFSKIETISPICSPDPKLGQINSSEKKSLPLILGKNSLTNKELSKILEPISPIKSPDQKLGQNEKKTPPILKTSHPLANKEFSKILEPISPIKNPFKYLDNTLVPATDSANLCEGVKVNYFYDKEDIPFTPGKVQRTRQKIEEKNLTRTMSFDSGFPFQSQSTPSTPPEGESTTVKVIRRSHSLRNDCRPFCGKWYPLPALASNVPVTFRRGSQSFQGARNVNLSISTPSVVEAVNRVICGTQEVLSSAIPFMPSKKASTGSSDSDFDFGSATSLPEIDSAEPQQRESPVPGLVKLQRDILENRGLKSDQDCHLVITDDIKESGIVKRLKKELEAKSTTKGERGAGLPEAENALNSVNKEPTKDCCSETPSSSAGKNPFDKAPPTPHRKTSLDLSCFMQRRFPLNIRLGSQPNIKPNTTRTTFASPPDLARTAEIPPAGLTRKLRKQQGSSHPLSKLIKQRHPNPLYNTM